MGSASARCGGLRRTSRAVAHQNAVAVWHSAHRTDQDRMRMIEKPCRILVGRGSVPSGASRADRARLGGFSRPQKRGASPLLRKKGELALLLRHPAGALTSKVIDDFFESPHLAAKKGSLPIPFGTIIVVVSERGSAGKSMGRGEGDREKGTGGRWGQTIQVPRSVKGYSGGCRCRSLGVVGL